MSSDPRISALQAVAGVLDDGRSLTDAPSLTVTGEPRDAALARHLAYGVLRWLSALEWLRDQLLDRPMKRKDRDVARLLLIGLHQLWRDRTPDHAAVHATAECCRHLGKQWATGLVNAVLRRFLRERNSLMEVLEQQPERHAHPAWLVDALSGDWPNDFESILEANNTAAPLWLRVNTARTSVEDAIGRLEEDGLRVTRHAYAPAAVAVDPPRAVDSLPGFEQGLMSVQDPAAQLAAELMTAVPGMRVLDACAAPGGKTAHLLEQVADLHMVALDRDEARLARVRENLDRLGLQADLRAADAAEPADWWDGVPFRRILLDAPCSATGVIRRHPEIKWLRDPDQVESAAAEQAHLLRRLWPTLEAGGILVYATCSVLERENNQQIHEFLSQHADAERVGPDARWGIDRPHGRQILPGSGSGEASTDMDGFFYACLRKNA